MEKVELFIVGAGAAGMSAAVAAAGAGVKSVLVADNRSTLGGILPQCAHRGFGLSLYGEELTGQELADKIAKDFLRCGAEIELETEVLAISPDKTALLSSRRGLRRIGFDRLILATGAREIPAGALPIAGTRPEGVYTAGEAQELINLRHEDIGQNIVILGSGDLGMVMAGQLHGMGKNVIAIAEREGHYGGMARNFHRYIEPHGIPILYRSTVTELFGAERLTGVRLTHSDSGETEIVACDTLLIAVGLVPERELVRDLGTPDWLTLCGNCRKIHDIVDSAIRDAETQVNTSFT